MMMSNNTDSSASTVTETPPDLLPDVRPESSTPPELPDIRPESRTACLFSCSRSRGIFGRVQKRGEEAVGLAAVNDARSHVASRGSGHGSASSGVDSTRLGANDNVNFVDNFGSLTLKIVTCT